MNQKKKTTIGGQALIEGILMRGPSKVSTVIRKANGEMVVKTEEAGPAAKGMVAKIPVIRGLVSFWDSMSRGFSAITYSASFIEEEENENPGWLERKLGSKKLEDILTTISIVLGVALPIGLFILLPTLISGWLGLDGGFARSLVEGLLRILIFFIFIITTSAQSDIKRTYMYHGAEHKSIHCYEAGLPLTVENVKKFTCHHPRCGTSFLFVVMIISILVFAVFQFDSTLMRMVTRLIMLPVVVGVSFEINRLVGRHDNAFTKVLRAPGLFLQNFTTIEPDDSMIEVAVTALNEVIPEKQGEDRW